MRLTKEDRYILKLVHLAKEVTRGEYSGRFEWICCMKSGDFRVWDTIIKEHVVSVNIFSNCRTDRPMKLTAKECYEIAVKECKKKGLMR